MTTTGSTQTIQRIGMILRCFTETEPELGVMQISRRTELHKSTTSRLLSALLQEGFVEKNTETGKYRLGLALVDLAGVVLDRQNLRQASQDQISTLAELTQETINISILDGDECVNIETVRSPKSIRYAGRLGRRTPLHCTSTGKIQLTHMNPEPRRLYLSQPLRTYTQNTVTNPNTLRVELAEIFDQGFAISNEEFEEGLVALAAPIWDHSGGVIASLSISGPTYRLDSETLNSYIPHLKSAAKNISRLMGYFPLTKNVKT